MSCENKKILLVFSSLIALVVITIVVFDWNLYLKAFLGTVILGLLCFMRSLMTAVEVPEHGEDDDEQVADEVSGDDTDPFEYLPEENVVEEEVGANCKFSVTSEEFMKHFEEFANSHKKH